MRTCPVRPVDHHRERTRRAPATRSSLIGGRYEIRSLLGSGGVGTVWLGWDERLRRRVALKEVPHDPDDATRSGEREARAAARITSACTVKVYDLVTDLDEGTDWIVMEALSGRDLASVLRSHGAMSFEEARYVGRHLLAALASVHTGGLVHRDVKPSNVQLCEDGRVVLTDFGLASTPCVDEDAKLGLVAGSLPYIAPEIVRHGRYSTASDLYALGVTLLAAVTGQIPASDTEDVIDHQDLRRSLATLSPEARTLEALLAGLLELDPLARFDAHRASRHLV